MSWHGNHATPHTVPQYNVSQLLNTDTPWKLAPGRASYGLSSTCVGHFVLNQLLAFQALSDHPNY